MHKVCSITTIRLLQLVAPGHAVEEQRFWWIRQHTRQRPMFSRSQERQQHPQDTSLIS